ncbi:hypothetical protein J2X69_003058 [Algoriphagus sp. 4150]|nr:hypothetical protein [Algoriphagus sp. 4150]
MRKFIFFLVFIGMIGCVDIYDHTSNNCERLNKELNELRFKYMSCQTSSCYRVLDDLNFSQS